MNEDPELVVSVLMPVYNAAPYLKESVESILNQTFIDFEFIIIDDGSTDRSLEILQDYANKDSRILLVSRENRGLIYTLNEAAAMAKAPYIARMDADDVSYPDRFLKQVRFLNEHPNVVAIGSKTRLIDSEGDPLCLFSLSINHSEIDSSHMLGNGGAIVHPAAMFRKEEFNSVGTYRSDFVHAEDVDLWLRMAEMGELGNLPDLLLDYRQHPGSIGHKYRNIQISSTVHAIKEACTRRGILYNGIKLKPSSSLPNKNQLYLKWGWWALNAGNIKTAKKYSLKALLGNPFDLEAIKLGFCVIRGY